MNCLIKQLENSTINKIAAGEVIESPKSIIKELVENSIDANADEIIVEIKNGGKKFIRITDNGVGIDKNQIEDAFKRHYTSKITTSEDLDSLHTLGFRGEALASIAAVSRVEVITRTANEDYGTKIAIEGGKTVLKEDIGCPIGTTFIVTDLFYNIPARLKFLKSDISESTKINEIVLCLALSTKNVSFKYINNNNTTFKTPKSDNMLNILSSLYGRDLINSLIEVNHENEFMKITGYTSNLNYYRGNRKYQLLFVNGRYVKHNRANFFIEAAYRTLLPKDKHPACFLCIDINTNLVDVNVHPAKTEIRVKEEERFLGEIKNAIYKALREINLVKEVKSENIVKKASVINNENNITIDEIFENSDSTKIIDLNDDNFKISTENKENIKSITNNDIFSDEVLKDFDSSTKDLIKIDENINIIKEDKDNYDLNVSNEVVEIIDDKESLNHVDKDTISNLRYIGMLFKTYILCESEQTNEFYMIDQHAAHERINYEKYLNQIENRNIILQELLIPEVINLSYEDYYFTINNKDFFEKIGLPIESFGINDILINSVPLIFIDVNIKYLFYTILDSMKETGKNSNLDFELNKIIKNACVSSVKSGDNLHNLEIKKLIGDLANTKSPYTCPHGRPTIIKMTKYEVERMFERVQI
ncbi:DNA mismatch repair endonuclease MutL [Sedimentibacter sp. zth1]|uniref:DNA mismatch repair endonuclease MutL n=1 Tax=Sedimentibacter sp. zth1 TaxID=2816908 RepID=UPI001A9263E3|nr:DNA mismatch repair endonuclease MutL [Sedimentibacter sp. zth1]QSX06507.1 DNA mismatch repair endonuclease MutL [Sedimentibacter sp. zth1]